MKHARDCYYAGQDHPRRSCHGRITDRHEPGYRRMTWERWDRLARFLWPGKSQPVADLLTAMTIGSVAGLLFVLVIVLTVTVNL